MAVILKLIVSAVWSVSMVFFCCEFGERAAAKFSKMDDEINQFEWYRYPIKIQRMIPTILISVQEPAVVKFFGSIACTRECFKKVILNMPRLRH